MSVQMLDMEILRPPIGSRGKALAKMNNNPQTQSKCPDIHTELEELV